MASWTVHELDTRALTRAVDAVACHRLSYWDALIWAVARENGLSLILTENLQDGQAMDGVLIRNPFADDFNLDKLLERSQRLGP